MPNPVARMVEEATERSDRQGISGRTGASQRLVTKEREVAMYDNEYGDWAGKKIETTKDKDETRSLLDQGKRSDITFAEGSTEVTNHDQ